MKKMLTFILSLALIFTLVPNQAGAESKKDVLLEVSKAIFEDGEEVGVLHRTITREIDGNKIILDTLETKEYHNGEVTTSSEITTIETIDENTATINGVAIDLNKELFVAPDSQMDVIQPFSITTINSGGRVGYTSWEDQFISTLIPNPYYTKMTSASGIKNRVTSSAAMFLDSGGAKNDAITKTVRTDGSDQVAIINFKHYASDVVSARNTINANVPLLMAALGVTVLTSASVIGAIGGAIGVAGFAIAIWDAGNDANSAMESAYALLQTF